MSVDWDWDMAAATTAFLLLLTVVAVFSPDHAAARGSDARAVAAQSEGADDPVDGGSGATPVADVPAASAGLSQRRRLPLPATILVCGLPLLVAVSWTFPYLSSRAQDAAVSQADQHPAAAADSARRAHSYDPLAVGPLITLSQIQQGDGRPEEALATLVSAERLQPDNFNVHYSLGLLLSNALHRDAAAASQFRLALALNPLDTFSKDALDALAQR
jgi:tetratricopeptide (TPR) repeat protein